MADGRGFAKRWARPERSRIYKETGGRMRSRICKVFGGKDEERQRFGGSGLEDNFPLHKGAARPRCVSPRPAFARQIF